MWVCYTTIRLVCALITLISLQNKRFWSHQKPPTQIITMMWIVNESNIYLLSTRIFAEIVGTTTELLVTTSKLTTAFRYIIITQTWNGIKRTVNPKLLPWFTRPSLSFVLVRSDGYQLSCGRKMMANVPLSLIIKKIHLIFGYRSVLRPFLWHNEKNKSNSTKETIFCAFCLATAG